MSKHEKGNILDIGCGKGLLLKNFSDKNSKKNANTIIATFEIIFLYATK